MCTINSINYIIPRRPPSSTVLCRGSSEWSALPISCKLLCTYDSTFSFFSSLQVNVSQPFNWMAFSTSSAEWIPTHPNSTTSSPTSTADLWACSWPPSSRKRRSSPWPSTWRMLVTVATTSGPPVIVSAPACSCGWARACRSTPPLITSRTRTPAQWLTPSTPWITTRTQRLSEQLVIGKWCCSCSLPSFLRVLQQRFNEGSSAITAAADWRRDAWPWRRPT